MVASGHDLHQVLYRYTVPQIRMFADLVSQRWLLEAKMTAITIRAAQHAKANDWRRFLRMFEKPDVRKTGEAPADALVRQLKANGLWRSLNK